ncbi:hypothetical protein B0J15DRAFT_484298 [Fusarium solani]|uniref:Histone acetyltransferase n=1 Tax=Fusarium solani TaxID=169388 RepID=A0A9P9KYI0_FUSSL|nr:uncharacterized protein B0J15DRAFT_484298 [Fusarium solani]KAH7271200.1 hypothetical protein B0J15DRAFT_484298 [Fusarium solani]
MTSAQVMEEELQQSVMVSDEDAEYETAGDIPTMNAMTPDALDTNMGAGGATGNMDDAELSDRDASGEELDIDAEGEEDNDFLLDQQISANNTHEITQAETHQDEEEEEEEEEDVDAEGEEYDEDEGVGDVKIQPGEEHDEEASDSERSESPSALDEESDEDAPWEDAGEADEDEDEDEEAGPSNNCTFCKQGEDEDPSEEFEVYLACAGCGVNAHQQCARDAAAMSEDNTPENWKCPECYHRDSDVEEHDEDMDDQSVNHDMGLPSQQSDVPDHSGEVRFEPDADDEPLTSQIDDEALPEEPADETRTLRKRKSSSLEDDDNVISLRKRRRNQSNEPTSSHEGTTRNGSAEPSRHNPSRTLRLKVTRPPPVTMEKRTRTSLVLKIQVRPGNLKEILSRKKRDRRPPGSAARPSSHRPAATPRANPVPTPITALPTPFSSDNYSQPFYSFFDRETDEMKGKPYGGILTEAEADTSKTLPAPEDRRKFDDANKKAEDEWRARVLTMQADADMPVRKHKKSSENASQIECIEFGGWEIDTWYAAPYPAEYSRNRVLYICEFCLKYMNSDYVAWRHKLKCPAKHPPGDEIYRHKSVSVFEVDGRKNPVYCQNLCLLAKLFLGSKTLYYDVEPFLFYVLCEYNDTGYHFVGYFSKEKRASSQNNVSCILTLPIHQRKGYGNLLIDFSYLLTKVEEKTGSPEKPLSDMGLVSYRNYWRLILCRYFLKVMETGNHKSEGLSIKRISDDTGMTPDDVISALEGLRALVRDPQTRLYAFRVDVDYCRQYVNKWEAKGYVQLKPEALVWTPYVMGRSNAVNFELGPPINTIAPREDDEAKVDEGVDTVGTESQPTTNGEGKSVPNADTNGDHPLVNGEAASTPVQSIEEVDPDQEEQPGSPKDIEMGETVEDGPPAWVLPYKDIPLSRFEVFPAVPGGRRDRSRQSASRPSAPRTVSSASRPKRNGKSHRPSSSSRPKSASKRKTGGTGRGPGRWPKGTKKSDYGNADSGPGLPPGWLEKQTKLLPITEGNDAEQEATGEEPAEDSVVVSTKTNGAPANGDAVEPNGTEAATDGEHHEDEEGDVDAEGEDV